MRKELIIKYFNNRCTENELKEILQWINSNAENEADVNLVFEIWKNFEMEDNPSDDEKLSLLFDKIQQKIAIDTSKSIEIKKNTFNIITSWLTKAAAVILVPVLAVLFYILSERNKDLQIISSMAVDSLEVIAPVGSRTVVHLSDGTEVHLNYGSKLKYPQLFYGETRGVLLSGEGYFAVAHDPDNPFFVKTQNLNIKALGTEFNVQSYPGEDVVSTTLVKGIVLLEKQLTDEKTEQLGKMKPGQHVYYNSKTGKIVSNVGDVEKYIAWKEGKMIFEDTPIKQIAKELSRMFNVDIKVDDEIKDYYYTLTFIDEPLFQILDLITIATPVVSYKVLPRKKLPDGTFTKQEIIIQKRS